HADLAVVLVAEAALDPGLGLDPDLVPAPHQVRASGRHQRDAAFQGLGLARNSDTHGRSTPGLWLKAKKKRRKRGAARAVSGVRMRSGLIPGRLRPILDRSAAPGAAFGPPVTTFPPQENRRNYT